MSIKYDNTQYWTSLHKKLYGTLRAVGWPSLSENFNQLKYQSEAESILTVFDQILPTLKKHQEESTKLLEIGVGTGYWTDLLSAFLKDKNHRSEFTCLDMSEESLQQVKQRHPEIKTIQADLKTIEKNRFEQQFDIVHALSVLHHIVPFHNFSHALHFAAESVRPGGYLIIYDPILTLDYSPYNTLDFTHFKGNGMPRRLNLMDDMLNSAGFERTMLLPGVSFILNSCTEGTSFWQYRKNALIWSLLCKYIHRHDKAVAQFKPLLLKIDQRLKSQNKAYSTNICVYKKNL